jgi:hypothetical protein
MGQPAAPELPLAVRWAFNGAGIASVIGGVAGLIIGLSVHPATAWFAVFEVGLPAAVVGTTLGAASGTVATVVRRIRARPDRPTAP